MRRGVQCEYNRGLQWKGLWSSYRKKPSRSRRKSVIQLDSFDSNCEDTICRQFRGPTVSGSHCVYEPIEQEIVPVSARTGHDPSYRGTALSLAVDDVVDGNNVDCEWETTVAEEQVSEDEGIEQVSTSGQGLGPETASDGAELCLYKTGVPGFVSFDGCQTPGERVAYIFCKSGGTCMRLKRGFKLTPIPVQFYNSYHKSFPLTTDLQMPIAT